MDYSNEIIQAIDNFDYSHYKMSFWDNSGNFIICISVLSICLVFFFLWAAVTKYNREGV